MASRRVGTGHTWPRGPVSSGCQLPCCLNTSLQAYKHKVFPSASSTKVSGFSGCSQSYQSTDNTWLISICDCSSSIMFEGNLVLVKNINGSGGLCGFFGGQADQPGIRVPVSFACTVSGACRSQQQSKWLPSVSFSPVGCCESVKW